MAAMTFSEVMKLIEGRFHFLSTEYNFKVSTQKYTGSISVEYARQDLNIWIAYGGGEYRPEVTFEISGEDCTYNDFFRLNEFSRTFFDDYKINHKFSNTIDFDLSYLEIFLRKYLDYILENIQSLYNRMRKNGHDGYQGAICPFKIDKDCFVSEKVAEYKKYLNSIEKNLPLNITKYVQKGQCLYLFLEPGNRISNLIQRKIILINMDRCVWEISPQKHNQINKFSNIQKLVSCLAGNRIIQIMITFQPKSYAFDLCFVLANHGGLLLHIDTAQTDYPVKIVDTVHDILHG